MDWHPICIGGSNSEHQSPKTPRRPPCVSTLFSPFCFSPPVFQRQWICDCIPWWVQRPRLLRSRANSGHKQAGIKWAHKHNIGSCDVSYPLRDWSNQDVFEYHVANGIPVNSDVYDEVDGELVPAEKEIHVQVVPQALNVLVPKAYDWE